MSNPQEKSLSNFRRTIQSERSLGLFRELGYDLLTKRLELLGAFELTKMQAKQMNLTRLVNSR